MRTRLGGCTFPYDTDSGCFLACTPLWWTLSERVSAHDFIKLMTSDRKLKASREGLHKLDPESGRSHYLIQDDPGRV